MQKSRAAIRILFSSLDMSAELSPAVAAKQATSTIPIIVGGAGDLVGTGLVTSLARPTAQTWPGCVFLPNIGIWK
jgi:hypothetical protein